MADAGREGGKPILRHSGGERSYVPSYTAFGAVAGVVVHGMVNAMRRRPVSYEPWWHVINAVAGATIMRWVAIKYDGTSAFMAGQMGSYAKMPTWAYDSLSDDELDSELRQERVGAFAATFAALAEAEEKEFLAAKKAAQLK